GREAGVNGDASDEARQQLANERTETGRRRYREVMVSDAPPPMTPYLSRGVVDSVFGELWDRPGLSRRDRRFITLACVAAPPVRAALASGGLTREEMQEVVLHFAYSSGWPRASALGGAYYRAVARLDAEQAGA